MDQTEKCLKFLKRGIKAGAEDQEEKGEEGN